MSNTVSQDVELQEFEATYQALVIEHFGTAVVPVADQIPLTEQLLAEADMGDVPHRGKMHHIAPLALDPTDAAVIQAAVRPPGGVPRLVTMGALLGVPLLLGWLLIALLFPSASTPATA